MTDQAVTDVDFDALEKLARAATAEPDTDDDADMFHRCHGCGATYTIAIAGDDPSALCRTCAHDHAAELGRGVVSVIAMARRTADAEAQVAMLRAQVSEGEQVQARMLDDIRARIAERDRADSRARERERERDEEVLRAETFARHRAEDQALLSAYANQTEVIAAAVGSRLHDHDAIMGAIGALKRDLNESRALQMPTPSGHLHPNLARLGQAIKDQAERIAELTRERDAARAALGEACADLRKHANLAESPLAYMTDERKVAAWEAVAAGAHASTATGSEIHVRPPLDPAHVEVLRGMAESALSSKRWELESLKDQYTRKTKEAESVLELEIAALEAVLGEPT